MIASEDFRRATVERTMRGHRCGDVDDNLKQVADSMDTLGAENDDLQKKLVVLAQRIDQYRAEEDTLRTTMINAQRLGENVIKEAKQKAAEIIRAATIRAEDREQHARDEVELAKQELITLRKEADNFKKTLIGMYREHIEVISKIPEYHGEEDDEAKPAMQEEAPAPAPVQEPEPQPAPEPQPVSQPEPEQEPEVEYADPGYYEEPAPAAPGGRVRTVEFAIAPKDDEPAPAPAEELPDASALFAQPAAAETPKKATRRSTTKKTTRKTKAKPQEEPLHGAFDSFEGVDYND